MPSGGKRTASAGKKLGRPEKPKIELSATTGIASTVLLMDGPPVDHFRACKCEVCLNQKKLCRCDLPEYKEKKLVCENCTTAKEHQVCHCEVCGWWELLLVRDRRIVHDTRKYLTDRRDGKPAQGVFLGDTRETRQPLIRGNLPSHFGSAAHAPGSHKPN